MTSLSLEERRSRGKARSALSRRDAALTTDALRIGVLSLSREGGTSLIEPLSRSALPVHPIRIHLETADPSASASDGATGPAVSLSRSIKDEPLDGLVLAGTPEPGRNLEELPRWRELLDVVEYARAFVPLTLGLGAGGLVLAKALGVDVLSLDYDVEGLVPQRTLRRDHALLSGSSEVFFSAEGRRFRLSDDSVDLAVKERRLVPLAYSRDAGVSIFESTDRRLVGHLGRPDRTPTAPAEGAFSAFFDSARESARAHSAAFFSSFVRRLYDASRRGRARSPAARP